MDVLVASRNQPSNTHRSHLVVQQLRWERETTSWNFGSLIRVLLAGGDYAAVTAVMLPRQGHLFFSPLSLRQESVQVSKLFCGTRAGSVEGIRET